MKRSLSSIIISVLCLTDVHAVPIQSGEVIEGQLLFPGDQDSYSIGLVAGDTIKARMAKIDVYGIWPYIELYSPNGQRLAYNNQSSVQNEVTVTVTNSGTFTVVCKNDISSTGRYGVSVLRMPGYPLSGNDVDVGTIGNGDVRQGTINLPGDLDAAFIDAVAGDTIKARMAEIDVYGIWPYIELYSPNGQRLAYNNQSSVQNEVTVTVTNSGTFTVVCKNDISSTGRYGVSALVFPEPSLVLAANGLLVSMWRRLLSRMH